MPLVGTVICIKEAMSETKDDYCEYLYHCLEAKENEQNTVDKSYKTGAKILRRKVSTLKYWKFS